MIYIYICNCIYIYLCSFPFTYIYIYLDERDIHPTQMILVCMGSWFVSPSVYGMFFCYGNLKVPLPNATPPGNKGHFINNHHCTSVVP